MQSPQDSETNFKIEEEVFGIAKEKPKFPVCQINMVGI
jgi:hypothetical protein